MWDITGMGTLSRPDETSAVARVHCELWVIEPEGELPGKWGGRIEVLEDRGLTAADFMFRLSLEDGREADCFVDLSIDSGIGLVDGNGPPPGVNSED